MFINTTCHTTLGGTKSTLIISLIIWDIILSSYGNLSNWWPFFLLFFWIFLSLVNWVPAPSPTYPLRPSPTAGSIHIRPDSWAFRASWPSIRMAWSGGAAASHPHQSRLRVLPCGRMRGPATYGIHWVASRWRTIKTRAWAASASRRISRKQRRRPTEGTTRSRSPEMRRSNWEEPMMRS